MAKTSPEQIEANRRNSILSTGPRTPEGIAKSRANALKHGLSAKILLVPTENAEVVAAQFNRWIDFYQPDDPVEYACVEQAARAALVMRRCDSYERAIITRQIREFQQGRPAREAKQAEQAEAIAAKLLDEPVKSLSALQSFRQGVLKLADLWNQLIDETTCVPGADRNAARHWDDPASVERAVLLLGPDQAETARQLRLLNAIASPKTDPADRADQIAKFGLPPKMVNAELARKGLAKIVGNEFERLNTLANVLEADEDEIEANAAAIRLIPYDPDDERTLTRYRGAAESTFFKAVKEIRKFHAERLARGAEEDPEAVAFDYDPADFPEETTPETPVPAAPKPVEESMDEIFASLSSEVSRNEAKPAVTASSKSDKDKLCVRTDKRRSDPKRRYRQTYEGGGPAFYKMLNLDPADHMTIVPITAGVPHRL